MTRKHLALIVEDEREFAEELVEILKSLDCESMIVDNKQDALAAFAGNAFCLILLDLQIKCDPKAIRGHVEHGNSVLREIRKTHFARPGKCHSLPVLIVSGFAHEADAAVDIMKIGADDVIRKLSDKKISVAVREALENSGRATHEECRSKRKEQHADGHGSRAITITGERVRRRSVIKIGSRAAHLTDSTMRVLLKLIVAKLEGKVVHKTDFGARADRGFKKISILRDELKSALEPGVDIVENDYNGNYWLKADVSVANCETDKLSELGDREITALARKLRQGLEKSTKKV